MWIKLGQSTPLGKGSLRRTWIRQLRKASPLVDLELAGAKLRLHLGDNRSEIKALQQSDRFMQDERNVIRTACAGQGDEPVFPCLRSFGNFFSGPFEGLAQTVGLK